jgi:drug/metabolite transporter (DMT)-like permease
MPAIQNSLAVPMTVMLISGACNTLLMKLMCLQVTAPGPGMAPENFDYPFFQSLLMMIGELMCLGVFAMTATGGKAQARAMSFPWWIMAIPVSMDWTATTLVNAAYVILPASTIQMCRGCIVLFTCMISRLILGRKQETFQYAGVALVALGITIVSLESCLYGEAQVAAHPTAPWIGISLCIGAQIFQATMMVVEEKYLDQYNVPPLQMVGLEGAFGCAIGAVLLTFLQPLGIERTSDAIYMIQHSPMVQICTIASMCSIACFNWSGVTVTLNSSATARSTIDVTRTVIIWAVELFMAWNVFSWLQLIGFVLLTLGSMVYNRIVVIQALEPAAGERQSLLNGQA